LINNFNASVVILIMKNTLVYLIIILFIASCNPASETENTAAYNKSLQPKVTVIDTTKLKVNYINPDSLTVITPGENGVPLPKNVLAQKPNFRFEKLNTEHGLSQVSLRSLLMK